MVDNKRAPSGLPDIASGPSAKKGYPVLIVLVVGLCFLVIMGLLWGQRASTSPQKGAIVDERYTVPNAIHPENHDGNDRPEAGETPLAQAPQKMAQENPAQQVPIDTMQQDLETQKAIIEAMEKERQARLAAPVMVVQRTSQRAPTGEGKTSTAIKNNASVVEQFESPTPHVLNAVRQTHRDTLISEGTLIPAVLESAIDSDLPGLIRAMVESPVYSDEGSRILIEAGSRLIGEYRSTIAQGQERVFVIWSTLISPKGIRISLASQGVDSLGRAGLAADSINRHFWERFGSATLLSLIGAGASNIGVHGQEEQNASQAYREAVSQSFAQSATEAYQKQGAIPPTLYLKPGKAILIFVAHPLDFRQVFQKAMG